MRRHFTLFVMMLMALASFAQFSGRGTGRYGDPYQVTTPAQLDELHNFVGSNNCIYVKLMNDIDMTDYIAQKYSYWGWSSIGYVEMSEIEPEEDDDGSEMGYGDFNTEGFFYGDFDGNNKTIKGLVIHENAEGLGLFGAFKGDIYDLTVEVDISDNERRPTYASGNDRHRINRESDVGDYVGGLIAVGDGIRLERCVVKGSVSGLEYVGGLCGYASSGDFINCSFEGTVSGMRNVGGICGGEGSYSFYDCHVDGDIFGYYGYAGGICGSAGWSDFNGCSFEGNVGGSQYVGGIVGELSMCEIQSCDVSCHLSGLYDMGGIVGHSYSATIKVCRVYGSINGRSYIGGIIGALGNSSLYQDTVSQRWSNSSISSCLIQGMMLEGEEYIGGIVGSCDKKNTTVEICEVLDGSINMVQETEFSDMFYEHDPHYSRVGGLAGVFAGTMTDCFSSGMEIENEQYVGGLVGRFIGGTLSNCYARNNISGLEYVGGLCGEVKGSDDTPAIVKSCFANNYSIEFGGNDQYKGRVFGALNGTYTIPANTDPKANVSLRMTKHTANGVEVTQFENNLLNGRDIAYTAATLERFYMSKGWDFTDVWILEKEGMYEGFPNLREVRATGGWVTAGYHLKSEPLVFNKLTGGELKVTYNESEGQSRNIGVQFTLVLPEGVSIKQVSGEYDIKPLGKLDGHSIACNRLSDGSYKIMVFSINMKRFKSAGDGLMSIALKADDSVEPDIYDVFFNDVVFAQLEEGATVSTSYNDHGEISMLEIIDGINGDVDGDGEVTITDVMNLVNHILGIDVEPFREQNADLNGDGAIDVSDVMTCVMMILNNNAVASIKAMDGMTSLDRMEVMACDEGYDILLDNLDPYTALQMNVKLPQGCKLKEAVLNPQRADGHQIATKQLENGSWNIVVWSMEGNELLNNGTRLVTLVTEGKTGAPAQVDGILLTNKQCEPIALQGVSGGATGIQEMETTTLQGELYNLQGVKVQQPTKGVYVRDGKKITIK